MKTMQHKENRFWSKAQVLSTEECWPWLGREADCRCATLDADLRPCEPCYLKLSPASREGAR